MFRIEFFCDDKRLHLALLALTGIAVGQPSVVPVINAVKSKSGLKQATLGSIVDLFAAHLRKTKPATVNAVDTKAFLTEIGRSPGSATYLLSQARAAGLIRKNSKAKGANSFYDVLPPKKG